MKNRNTKILIALIAIILVIGTIMIFVKGLSYELRYQKSQKVELAIGKTFEEKDVREITNAIFGKQQLDIQAIEIYKDAISITTTEITEEQKTELVSKINEKYGTELKSEEITIEEVAHTRGRDIIKPYIVPFIIITAVVLVYFAIRYIKLNSFKILLITAIVIVLSQVILLDIMAITRMQIGTLTMPAVIMVYILAVGLCSCEYEKQLDEIKSKEQKKKNK